MESVQLIQEPLKLAKRSKGPCHQCGFSRFVYKTVGKGFVLHQHFIVENCGDGIRLRAHCSVNSSGCFLFCPDDASDVYSLLYGSYDDQMCGQLGS